MCILEGVGEGIMEKGVVMCGLGLAWLGLSRA